MLAILYAIGMFVAALFKSRSRLEAENVFLRYQLTLALRQKPPRMRLRGTDRALLVWMVRLWPSLLDAVHVVQPETILRWHRAGVRAFWRWRSRNRAGRPRIDRELRELIRRMSMENSLWGASRIHGELLKLGYEVAQSTVSKYSIVPTLTFERLFAFLVLGHSRRQLLWFEVTRHPTAAWLSPANHRSFPLGHWPLPIWCATMTGPMGRSSSLASRRWASAIG